MEELESKSKANAGTSQPPPQSILGQGWKLHAQQQW